VYRQNQNLGDFFMFFRSESSSKILKMTHIGVILCGKIDCAHSQSLKILPSS
jgi:hypothetical protein